MHAIWVISSKKKIYIFVVVKVQIRNFLYDTLFSASEIAIFIYLSSSLLSHRLVLHFFSGKKSLKIFVKETNLPLNDSGGRGVLLED